MQAVGLLGRKAALVPPAKALGAQRAKGMPSLTFNKHERKNTIMKNIREKLAQKWTDTIDHVPRLKSWTQNIVDLLGYGEKLIRKRLYPNAIILDGFHRSIQIDNYSCGANSAYAILKYHGKNLSVEDVRTGAKTSADGTWGNDVIKLFRKKRLSVSIKRSGVWNDIKDAINLKAAPVLISVDDNHFSVVYGYDNKAKVVFVADPSFLVPWFAMDRKEFLQRYWDRWAAVVSSKRKSQKRAKAVATKK